MSLSGKSSNLKAKIIVIHSQIVGEMDHLISEVEDLKNNVKKVFSDFTQECMDVEDRLKDVLKEKMMLVNECQNYLRKEKEGCKKCAQLEGLLFRETRKLKQYERKMNNIASLLHTNTMKSNLIATEGSQGMNSDKKDYPLQGDVEEKNDLTEPIVIKDEDDLPSKILVHEKEDEEYFEITIKRKTPENCPETFIEFPETVCEDGLNSDHTKRVLSNENSPIQHETPSKRRKLIQQSSEMNQSQRSTKLKKDENQIVKSASPLHLRNKAVVDDMRENNVEIVDKSPSIITKPKLRSRLGISDQQLSATLEANNGIDKIKKNLGGDDFNSKESNSSAENRKRDIAEQNKNNYQNDETRFPMFEHKDQEDEKEVDKFVENKVSTNVSKLTLCQNNQTLNGSKIWEDNIDSDDDFVDSNQRRVKLSRSREKKDSSFTFTEPSAPNTKWKLKVLNSSINKSKLKQTKLTLEKKVGKIDITEVEGYNGGVAPGENQIILNEIPNQRTKKLIIEETQIQDEKKQSYSQTGVKHSSSLESHSSTDKNTNGKSFTQLSLPDESLFLPNAVSTQKTQRENKPSINTRQSYRMKRNNEMSPKKSSRQSLNKNKKSITMPKNEKSVSCSNQSNGKGNSTRKPLFLPRESRYNKKMDFTSQWRCPDCREYFLDSYGPDILKLRPPPKKCGHNSKYPATPPDFWDPMCS
ncbi:hypothetical protein M8J76_005556 [Diaphorina citri]|nr:hypothetical protein M8J76_005556 [Diaphorina citri]